MTVQELIEELQKFDPEVEVHFAYNYGDHWRTQVAPAVGSVDEAHIKYSSYHNMPALAGDNDTDDNQKQVVVLQA